MRHVADVDTEIAAPFRCRRCGAAGSAKVIGRGIGSGASVLGLGARLADQAALAEATADAADDARRTVALARCPSCGHRSMLAVGLVVVPVVGGSIVMGSLGAVMCFLNAGLITLGLGVLFLFVAFTILLSGYHRFRAIPEVQLTPSARLLK